MEHSLSFLSNIYMIFNYVSASQVENGYESYNGIVEIIIAIVSAIVSGIITWKCTKMSITQIRLSYNKKIINIFSNSIESSKDLFSNIKILYGDNELNNPCLLLVELQNSGNKSILNPPISIKTDTKIYAGYFQDVPNGYEEFWKMQQKNDNCCNIFLDHINPKQTVKAYFFLDHFSENISIECPMPDLLLEENKNEISSYGTVYNIEKFIHSQKETVILSIAFLLILLSFNVWDELIAKIFYRNDFFRIYSNLPLAFILSTLGVSVILNILGIKRIDNYLLKHKENSFIIMIFLLFISAFLLFLIIFDIFIVNFYLQILVGFLVSIILAFFIHFACISRE